MKDRGTENTAQQAQEAKNMAGNGALSGAVIAVAGAGGPAGRATLLRLAEAGATVVGAGNDPERLAEAGGAGAHAPGGATATRGPRGPPGGAPYPARRHPE